MKYKAIIETDDYGDFEFFEDGNGKYMVGKDAGATSSGGWMPLYFTEEQDLDTLQDDIQNDLLKWHRSLYLSGRNDAAEAVAFAIQLVNKQFIAKQEK
jgi:hypothetical protein